MTIQIGDPQTGDPAAEGVYVVRVRDPSYPEMFAWRSPFGWSKPYKTALACLEDNREHLGHNLPRYKRATYWVDVTSWRTYGEPPLFPVKPLTTEQPAPTPDSGNVLVDLLKRAMDKLGGAP